MATVKRRLKKKHTCSCGRSFAHAISLKRHRFVSGCPETDEEEEVTAKVATEPEDEPVTGTIAVATLTPDNLSVGQIQALQNLANSRLHPTPSLSTRIERCIDGGLRFTAEFLTWLAEETSNLSRFAGKTLFPWLGAAARTVFSVATVAVLLTVFIGGIATGLSIRQAHAATKPAPTRVSDAAQAVTDFYRAVNGRAYSAAYQSLSNEWRRALSAREFEMGYLPADKVECQLMGVTALADNTAQVEVELDVYSTNGRQRVIGYYLVVREGGRWVLDGSRLTVES